MFRYVFLLVVLFSTKVDAHQFLPTYPKFEQSFISEVSQTKMEIFNKRKDVEYYELGVFDSNWNALTFASENKLIHVKYLQTKPINVYVRNSDLKRVSYICTESKLSKAETKQTLISSKICSKIK
jgi:hypothetical protein